MHKRGQVTVFIIIAIFIVVAGVLFFVFKDSVKKEISDVPLELAPIKNFVDDCVKNSMEEAITIVGEGGGYYFPPILSNSEGYTYYFYEGKDYFPSLKDVEENLYDAFSVRMFSCLNSFEDFPEYNVENYLIDSEIEIFQDSIVFDVVFPIRINKDQNSYVLKDFGTHRYYVGLGKIHEGIYNLIREGYYTEESVCIDCFSEMVLDKDLSISLLEGGLGDSIFIIGDYNKDYNRTFNYIFVV